MAKRIQRRRTKGWKMPPNTVSVTRPGKFGNPFKVGMYVMLGDGTGNHGWIYLTTMERKHANSRYVLIESAQQAVEVYRELRRRYPLPKKWAEEIRNRDLACFCALDQPCHADVLLEIANG